jgi:hypothetical protein
MDGSKGRALLLGGVLSALLVPTMAMAANVKYLDANQDIDPRFKITAPVSTYWHELWPCWCTPYHLSSWQDNGDGFLSPSDIIDLTDLNTGGVSWWHVERVTITIFITEKDMGTETFADYVGEYDYSDIMYNPISSDWEWIPPGTGGFHLSSWEDNGDGYLSESDQIDITDWEGNVSWWHIDRVTTDMVITPEPGSIAMIGVGLVGLLGLRLRRK